MKIVFLLIGTDGRPVEISHVLQLQDTLKQDDEES